MNKKSFLLGIYDSLPVCVAFSFMFFSLGTLAHLNSFSFMQSIMMTAGIYAAPLQAILLNNQSDFIGLIGITTLLVNFRFIIMSASINSYFKDIPYWKLLLALSTLSASSFTVSYARVKNGLNDIDFFSYFLAVSVFTYLIAIIATLLGYLIVAKLSTPYLTTLFAFVLPIHFSGLSAKYMPNIKLVLAIVLGIVLMPVCLIFLEKISILVLPFLIAILLSFYDYSQRIFK
jgi:predicted branched-subunit amino acid permease